MSLFNWSSTFGGFTRRSGSPTIREYMTKASEWRAQYHDIRAGADRDRTKEKNKGYETRRNRRPALISTSRSRMYQNIKGSVNNFESIKVGIRERAKAVNNAYTPKAATASRGTLIATADAPMLSLAEGSHPTNQNETLINEPMSKAGIVAIVGLLVIVGVFLR